MTSAPVPLAEQIEFIRRHIQKLEVFATGRSAFAYKEDVACLRAVLATLQQHERAMAVVEAAFRFCTLNGTAKAKAQEELAAAVMKSTPWQAALDAAANTAGDAVTTEEDKQNHGDEDRC